MKKCLLIFLSLLDFHTQAKDAVKLGSEDDPIRQMLFASQSLKEQVRQMHLDGTPGPLQSIADASKLVDEGKKTEAISSLRTILKIPGEETRVMLWVWSALRELGETPDPKDAHEVLGVIIEFPSGENVDIPAYDTLAAYSDGSSRYLNYSGKAIFWDAKDAIIKSLCQAFIDSTAPVSNLAKPRNTLALPKGGAQVTLLTRSGNYVVANPPQPVINAGAALMIELIKRTKEKNDQQK